MPPTRRDMPQQQSFYDKFGDQVQLVSIDIGGFYDLGSPKDAQVFLREQEITYPAGFSPSIDPIEAYNTGAIPAAVFITAEGNIFHTETRFPINEELLTDVVQQIVPLEAPTSSATPERSTIQIGDITITQYSAPPPLVINPDNRYVAMIRTNRGDMTLELFPKEAPITVNNFVFLAREGFYNGAVFHRVIRDFMIQGGDPQGTGRGGPGYQFEDEIVPSLVFDRPSLLAMGNAGPGTNGSQFFVTVVPTPHLNGLHTIFGTIIEGQDVLDAISTTATGAGDRPLEDVVIQTVEIQELEN